MEPRVQNQVGHVTDMGFLAVFCSGNKVKMQHYIDLYLRLMPVNIQKIEKCISQKKYGPLLQTVHDMKTHLKCMGMTNALQYLENMEVLITEKKNPEQLPDLLNRLNEDYKLSIVELA